MASGARCTSIYAGRDDGPALVRTTSVMFGMLQVCLLLGLEDAFSHLQIWPIVEK